MNKNWKGEQFLYLSRIKTGRQIQVDKSHEIVRTRTHDKTSAIVSSSGEISCALLKSETAS